MSKLTERKTDKKTEIVRAAAALFRRKGYNGTGLNEILEASGAPKGSLYHYFPRGKEQIGAAAMDRGAAWTLREMAKINADSASTADFVRAFGRATAKWLEKSDYENGCAIATTLLETAHTAQAIREAGRRAFDSWRDALEARLMTEGVAPERAKRLSALAVAAFEGGMILARVEREPASIVAAMDEAADAIEAAVVGARQTARAG